jgi:hypothetical protein
MAKKINFEQLLEYVVNGETAKADELFHQLVVQKSREIYEGLIEDEMKDVDIDEESEEDEDDEKVDEATDEDEEMDEGLEVTFAETDDDMDPMGGDPTDDLANDVGDDGESDDDGMDMGMDDMGGAEGGTDHDVLMDLKSDLADLMAKFDSLMGDEMNEPEHNDGVDDPDFSDMDDNDGDDDMAGDEEEEDDEEDESTSQGMFEEEIEEIDLSPAAQMREYVEKIGSWEKTGTTSEGDEVGKGGRYTTNTKSVVAGKNDMGGTAKNIAQGGTQQSPVEANKGNLKGNGVMNGKPKDMNTGNVNKVGGTNVKQFYKANTRGHGAEKKGEAEGKLWGNGGSAGSINTKSPLNKGK